MRPAARMEDWAQFTTVHQQMLPEPSPREIALEQDAQLLLKRLDDFAASGPTFAESTPCAEPAISSPQCKPTVRWSSEEVPYHDSDQEAEPTDDEPDFVSETSLGYRRADRLGERAGDRLFQQARAKQKTELASPRRDDKENGPNGSDRRVPHINSVSKALEREGDVGERLNADARKLAAKKAEAQARASSLAKPALGVLDLGLVNWKEPVQSRAWDKTEMFYALEDESGGRGVKDPVRYEGVLKSFDELAEQATYRDCFRVGTLGAMHAFRGPPVAPKTFNSKVRQRVFTNDADIAGVIALQHRVATCVLRGSSKLQYDTMDYKVNDVPQLVDALLLASNVEVLNLEWNQLRDDGTAALAAEFTKRKKKLCAKVTSLTLNFNAVGDEGLAAMTDALVAGVLPSLTRLTVTGDADGRPDLITEDAVHEANERLAEAGRSITVG